MYNRRNSVITRKDLDEAYRQGYRDGMRSINERRYPNEAEMWDSIGGKFAKYYCEVLENAEKGKPSAEKEINNLNKILAKAGYNPKVHPIWLWGDDFDENEHEYDDSIAWYDPDVLIDLFDKLSKNNQNKLLKIMINSSYYDSYNMGLDANNLGIYDDDPEYNPYIKPLRKRI